MTKAVYPGSFDPLTNGHEDIIRRAAKIFDELTIGLLINSSKNPLFSQEEKTEMIYDVIGDLPNVKVKAFDGLLIDFVQSEKADVILRGMRGVADFEYEINWSQANRRICRDIDTVFMATDPQFAYLSSSVVREIARYNGDISGFVSPKIVERIKSKFTSNGGNLNE